MPNNTGLPDQLKSGIESLSGMNMDNVKVHYNSSLPAQLNAHAFAQGTDIHIAPGQERHLPHEAWHVVQQAQGRVRPTMQMKGLPVNNNVALEREADRMGNNALAASIANTNFVTKTIQGAGLMGKDPHSGSIDYFLKIDGIEGESKDSKHGKEIQILSFSWGQTQPVSIPFTSGGGSGKVNMEDLTVTMYACKASPKIFLSCAKGEHIKSATLVARKAGGSQEDFYSIKLEEVLISSYHTGGGTGDTLPLDVFTLAFAKINYEYRPQKDKGALDTPVKAGWNLEENKAL